MRVELTGSGSLIIPAEAADACFEGARSAIVVSRDDDLRVSPLRRNGAGGLILKQRNARGDRSVLVLEQLPHDRGVPAWDAGERDADWDQASKTLRVPLRLATCVANQNHTTDLTPDLSPEDPP